MEMPEEINRILTDRISNALFCPTDTAVNNLMREGFDNMPIQIIKNGDVMQDAAMYYADKAQLKSDIIRKAGLNKFVLATIHRQENTDNPENLKNIIEGLNAIHKEIPVVVPMHPRTRNILAQNYQLPDFTIIDPVGYFDMIMLLKSCEMVITDSGGVQKEAFFFAKHCITLREQTEWVELVDKGFNLLVGSDIDKLRDAFDFFRNKQSDFSIDLYGNGKAAEMAAAEIFEM
jgi:UDP-GlcNAc3NAcA epimerase